MSRRSQYWCFTLNNPTRDSEARLTRLAESDLVSYLVFGREVAPTTGTPHLQGYVEFVARRTFNQVRTDIANANVSARRGTAFQAAEYCRKEGDFVQFGDPPANVPTRTGATGHFAQFVEWVSAYYAEHSAPPSDRVIANQFPALYVRYSNRISELVRHLCPLPVIQEGELDRDWQIDANNILHQEPDDRTVIFFVDPEGMKGKSWFQRWFFSNNSDKTQLLSIGKRDDIAHCIDPNKTVFLFNIPRGGMEFLQYTILEQIKDRVVFSPKYTSQTKLMTNKTHVMVFCNEAPDLTKMSEDRFHVINL